MGSTTRVSTGVLGGILAPAWFLACAPPEEPSRDHWADVADSTEIRLIREPLAPCEDCISLERVLVIGDTIGEGYLREAYHMVRDSAGNYWFGQYEAVKVFDAAGNFVGEVGRAGEGPMEWSNAIPAHADRDGHVHVFDTDNLRRSEIGRDFTLADEARIPGRVVDALALAGGERWVVNMWHPVDDALGFPLHLLEGEEIVTSFGGMVDLSDRRAQPRSMRILASDGADRIFASAWDRFEIAVWSDAGRRITGFEDPAFHERLFDSDAPTSADNPPTHRMRALKVDSDERLWVATWRRRDDWLDLMEERVGPRGEVRLEVKSGHDYSDIYDNQIDVIDLASARVIARARMAEGVLVDFLGDDALWVGEYRENGDLRVAIWEIGFNP